MDELQEPGVKPGKVRRERKQTPCRSTPLFTAARWSIALALGLLAWFAPAIIAHTPLRDWALHKATQDVPAQIHVGHVSLGWLSPVVAGSVVIEDESGQPLAEIESVQIARPLWKLLLDHTVLEAVYLQRPVLHLAIRESGSNLEDLLEPFLASGKPSRTIPKLVIEVSDGAVELTDLHTQTRWLVEHCHGVFELGTSDAADLVAKLSGEVQDPRRGTGKFAIEAECPLATNDDGALAGAARIAVTTENLTTAVFGPLASRWAGTISLSGDLTADCELTLRDDEQQVQVRRCEWRDAQLAAPRWLGEDQLQMAVLTVVGNLRRDAASSIRFDELTLQSDVASCRLHGRIAKTPDSGEPGRTLGELFEASDLEAAGKLDLARLAAMLPNTLHVRPGTQITSGRLMASLASHRKPNGQHLEGHLQTSDLAATFQEQELVWRQPLKVDFSARNTPDGPVIEQLIGTADFMRLEGQGTLAAGSLVAEADLDRLITELSRFVALDELHLAGLLKATLNWRRGEVSPLEVSGEALVERFVLSAPQMRPWHEQRLEVKLTGRGALAQASNVGDEPRTTSVPAHSRLTRVDAAELRVDSGDDHFQAELTQPIAHFTKETAWPLKGKLAGQLERWLARMQVFAPLDGWDLAGRIDAEGVAAVSPRHVRVEASKVTVDEFDLKVHGLFIREPQVRGEFAGTWDLPGSRVISPATVFQSSALSFRATNVDLQFFELPHYQGSATFQGDLARVGRWLQDPRLPVTRQYRGTANGNVQLTYAEGTTQARWQTELKDFALLQTREQARSRNGLTPVASTNRFETLWTEPRVSLRGDARLIHAEDTLEAHSLEVAASAINVRSSGRILRPAGDAYVQLAGELDYNLPQLVERFRGYLGPEVQVTGTGTRAFQLDGPIWPIWPAPVSAGSAGAVPITLVSRELAGHGSLAWDSAQAFGLRMGGGELTARMADAVVRVDPLNLAVFEGRLKLAPRVELLSPTPHMTLPPGPVAEQMRFSPELCQKWFKFIAPLLADATSAEGTFSVAIDGAQIPLGDPTTGQARGTMKIHAGRIGPGPLSRELIGVVQQARSLLERRPLGQAASISETWITLPEQDVLFDWKDQSVQHRNLTMLVRDTSIRTHGTVGLDQSLALVAEIPIRDEWVAGEPLLAGLRGQSVQIPIRGTMSAPRPDARALEQLGKQVARDAAGRILENELQKGLKKLFRP